MTFVHPLLSAEKREPMTLTRVPDPGLYAWWGAGSMPWPADFPPVDHSAPVYVGIAAGETLGERGGRFHLGSTRGSALRRSLVALLAPKLGLLEHVVSNDVKRPSKFGLEPIGERILTDWMLENLTVTWVTTAEPQAAEKEILRALHPPLNDTHATGSPYRLPMRSLRKEIARHGLERARSAD